jgi:hypothetical protein
VDYATMGAALQLRWWRNVTLDGVNVPVVDPQAFVIPTKVRFEKVGMFTH